MRQNSPKNGGGGGTKYEGQRDIPLYVIFLQMDVPAAWKMYVTGGRLNLFTSRNVFACKYTPSQIIISNVCSCSHFKQLFLNILV
jgi:hypothetical protein